MAFITPPNPGAVISARFQGDAPSLDAEIAALVQRVDGLLKAGTIRAFLAARRLEAGAVVIDVFPAEPGAAGTVTSLAALDGRSEAGIRPVDALAADDGGDADWASAAAAIEE